MHVSILHFRMNISLWVIYYWCTSVKLLPPLFPVKLNVNTSGATGPFDAAAVIHGKTNDFAELLEKLWLCLNEWELVGLIKVRARNRASTGQLEGENFNKLLTEHDPVLLFGVKIVLLIYTVQCINHDFIWNLWGFMTISHLYVDYRLHYRCCNTYLEA